MTTTLKRSGEANVFSPLPGLQSFFTDPFLRNWFNWDNDTAVEDSTLPAVNIGATENTFELAVAAPGMDKSDFKVELGNNRLVIKGERTAKENQQSHNWLRKEYNYTSFQRSFTLSERQVNAEGINARYSDGILYVSIPKSAEAKNRTARIIQVS